MGFSPHSHGCSTRTRRCAIGAARRCSVPKPGQRGRTRTWWHCLSDSVIDSLYEPLVAAEVVVQLAEQGVVEHRLPVLTDDGLVPPFGLYLPARDRVD